MKCPFCAKPIDLFSAMILRDRRTKKRKVVCPSCKAHVDI